MNGQSLPARQAPPPLANRLHALTGRLSRMSGFVVAQADVAEAVARIVQLERVLAAVLDHVDHVDYHDAGGSRLGEATPVISGLRMVLGAAPCPRAASFSSCSGDADLGYQT